MKFIPFAINAIIFLIILIYSRRKDDEYVEYEALETEPEDRSDGRPHYKFYISGNFGNSYDLPDTPIFAKEIVRNGTLMFITLMDGTHVVTDIKNLIIFELEKE